MGKMSKKEKVECPKCGARNIPGPGGCMPCTLVSTSDETADTTVVYKRYHCGGCGKTWTKARVVKPETSEPHSSLEKALVHGRDMQRLVIEFQEKLATFLEACRPVQEMLREHKTWEKGKFYGG